MFTLALDTTTRAGSVAVLHGTTTLVVVPGDATRTHGERLPGELDRALRQARLTPQQLDLLVVASGPGAFTGLRIGLAAIQGLAMVIDKPVIAVSALDALALSVMPETDSASDVAARNAGGVADARRSFVSAWMDAQRAEVFSALYALPASNQHDWPRPLEAPIVAKPAMVLEGLPTDGDITFVGDGALRYEAQILEHFGASPQKIAVSAPPEVLAPFLARIGIQRAAQGEAGPPHSLQPLYVRRPDAELERLRKRGAAADAPDPSPTPSSPSTSSRKCK